MADITVTLNDMQQRLILRAFEERAAGVASILGDTIHRITEEAMASQDGTSLAAYDRIGRAAGVMFEATTDYAAVRGWLTSKAGTSPLSQDHAEELAAGIAGRYGTRGILDRWWCAKALAELITLIYGLDASGQAIEAKADQLIAACGQTP